jgi:hypothetical protein
VKQSRSFLEAVSKELNLGIQTFSRKTVWRLMRHIEAIEDESQLLLQQIERTIDEHKPVVLPRKVAEALEDAKERWAGDYEQIVWMIPGMNNFNEEFCQVLFKYGNEKDSGFYKLIDALRNGYTVEESPKETLEEDIRRMIREWMDTPLDENVSLSDDERAFARRITNHVKRVYEDQQSG